MGDPELHSDETVIIRTQGVYIKSIPFEGILTNKRVILVDRAKNLLPPKEIPFVTIKSIETGENAIRDQTLTLSVMAKTGETRQMILTFSRQAGGNRIKERDDWAKILKKNTTSQFGQTIRKVIPGLDQAPKKASTAVPPKIEIVNSPVSRIKPADTRTPVKKAADGIQPEKKSRETIPALSAPEESGGSDSGIVIFCSRCGNKVTVNSSFCNRCGSKIIVPGSLTAPVLEKAPASSPQYEPADSTITMQPRPSDQDIRIPADLLRDDSSHPHLDTVVSLPQETENLTPLAEKDQMGPPSRQKPSKKGIFTRLFPPKKPSPSRSKSILSGGEPSSPHKPKRRALRLPKKRKIIGLVVVLILVIAVVVGVLFIYPMITTGGTAETVPAGSTTPAVTVTQTIAPSKGTVLLSGTLVVPVETTPPAIPATGVYVHVNYIGSWKGTYGLSGNTLSMTNSGDRVLEVVNATGTVKARFEKLDGSKHGLLVEIYKNGAILTTGSTTAANGFVALSADTVTGVASAPETSGGAIMTTATTSPAANVTTVTTTAM
jgi:DNA-directed RNA polymerase subunit RPC12/RpoP